MNDGDVLELYQQVILDHNKKPRNFRHIPDATHKAEGFNPLCGDQLELMLKINAGGTIEDIAFEGSGCAISKSSASMLTQSLKGKTESEARALFEQFHELVAFKKEPPAADNKLGKLMVFSGIWHYPARVKCASLAWHTLVSALDHVKQVSTE